MKHHGVSSVFLVCAVLGAHSDFAHAQPVPAPVQLIVKAGQQSPRADGQGTFAVFTRIGNLHNYSPSISGDNVTFGAQTTEPSAAGMYAFIDGQLRFIADTNSPIPGTNATFGFGLGDGEGPNISGRTVAFGGRNISVGSVIFLWRDGVLENMVDTNTLVPGRNVTFGSFVGTPGISGDNIVFHAIHDEGGGIYAIIDGELRTIADTDMVLPGAQGAAANFGRFEGISPSISGENIVFWAASSLPIGFRGIYLHANGVTRVIVDPNTPKPGGGGETIGSTQVFANFWPGISGENVAFSLRTGGLLAYINGTLHLIAEIGGQAPGGGTYATFSARTSIDGENIAFGAGVLGGGGSGIFSYVNGEFRTIADFNTPAPGFAGNFLDFNISDGGGPGISGERVVFTAKRPSLKIARFSDGASTGGPCFC